MKSESQLNHARARLRERIQEPGLNDVQKALIMGAMNALLWTLDELNATTMERLLSDEPMAAGKDPQPAMQKFNTTLQRIADDHSNFGTM